MTMHGRWDAVLYVVLLCISNELEMDNHSAAYVPWGEDIRSTAPNTRTNNL